MSSRRSKAAIIGIGYSGITRDPVQSLGLDTVDACRKAVQDAGLRLEDIDGVSASATQPFANAGATDGVDMATPDYLVPALALPNVSWKNNDRGLLGNSLVSAIEAIAAGRCNTALVWRALSFPKGETYGLMDPSRASGNAQLLMPYGYTDSGGAAYGAVFRRYMLRYGATREDMAALVVNSRRNALWNERGYYFNHQPEPLTREGYLRAPMISDPVTVCDSDLPVQFCAAWVLTGVERAASGPHHPAYIAGYSQAADQSDLRRFAGALEPYQAVARSIGDSVWKATGLQAKDIDTANLYDGFSIFTWIYLDGLGFCPEGEAHRFVQGGRIELKGEFPLNTSGGSLGEGRVHGSAHVTEAALQVMGRAGIRQVKDAHLALSTTGLRHGGLGQAMVFCREPI